MRKFIKIIAPVMVIMFITATLSVTAAGVDTNNHQDFSDINFVRFSVHSEYDAPIILDEFRIYLEEHVFGHDNLLDGLFNDGNLFINVVILESGGVILTEYRTSDNTLTARTGCQFGVHLGPIQRTGSSVHRLHAGGGAGTPGGVLCANVTVQDGVCLTCRVTIRESFSIMVWCRDC